MDKMDNAAWGLLIACLVMMGAAILLVQAKKTEKWPDKDQKEFWGNLGCEGTIVLAILIVVFWPALLISRFLGEDEN